MDLKFSAILSIAIIPKVIELICEKNNISEIKAINLFYNSKTYELLEKEETKMWYYSPLTIHMIWDNEYKTGELIFPEG